MTSVTSKSAAGSLLAPATGFMEDNFSVDGRGDGSGSHESSAGYGAGSNGSDR